MMEDWQSLPTRYTVTNGPTILYVGNNWVEAERIMEQWGPACVISAEQDVILEVGNASQRS
jgi:hypothetical protein